MSQWRAEQVIPVLLKMPKLSAKALVSALPYALKADFEEQLYKVYMTDSAWSLVVAVTGVQDRPARYIDIIRPPKVDTRTPEQVQADMGDFIKNIAALIKVKTIVTLVVVAVFAALALQEKLQPDTVMTIVTMVVAFYFGTQSESKNKKDE